jgi:hypothetical protein
VVLPLIEENDSLIVNSLQSERLGKFKGDKQKLCQKTVVSEDMCTYLAKCEIILK